MKSVFRPLTRLVLIAAVAGRFGLAQQPAPEKHVKDIRVEFASETNPVQK
jgi:hypothetical protein